jgi:Ca2+/Na+ antiporter
VVGSNIFNVLFVLGLAALIAANDRGFGAGAAFRTGRPDRAPGRAPFVGVSQLVIGLTMIDAGTSLPELAPSLLASIRGELGRQFSPGGLPVPPGALTFDIPVMIAVAVAALPVFFTGGVIACRSP